MKRFVYAFIATVFVGTLAVTAQPPGGRGGPPGGQGGQQGPGGRQGGPPPNPVLEALDTDGDHEVSAREIKVAAVSLKKLDRNRDGKLTHDELHSGGGPGHGGHHGGAEGGRRGPGGEQGGGPGAGGPPNAEQFVSHAMTFDTDKDGKLNKREIAKMAEAVVKEMGQRGGGHGPGGHGQGGGPPGGEGGGRQRPEVE